jgi:hypothetical protein
MSDATSLSDIRQKELSKGATPQSTAKNVSKGFLQNMGSSRSNKRKIVFDDKSLKPDDSKKKKQTGNIHVFHMRVC